MTASPSRRSKPAEVDVLDAVKAQPGRPLYKIVKQSLIDAIEAGTFKPGSRLPSTKEISRQMSVSLVTAHRALQELVTGGVLERTQGRGTFVIERSRRASPRYRLGVWMQPEASMADYYHSQLFEGMRQAAQDRQVELMVTRMQQDPTAGADGVLVINPTTESLSHVTDRLGKDQAVAVVGARSAVADVASFDVDNRQLAEQAVRHLYKLGHRRIAYVGGAGELPNSVDRREGFAAACNAMGMGQDDCPVFEAKAWQLDAKEKMDLSRLLNGPGRPTAVFAGGYYLALDLYEVASGLGLGVPDDLSVVGVDNPPSSSYLSPALTTFAQPLIELGNQAVNAVVEHLLRDDDGPHDHILRAELLIRASSSAPPA
ncbi:MAG: GntR family transcriptional regulator [Planctomycetota bacterium]